MTSHGKRRFGRILLGVLAAAISVPASAAAYVQIGGYLVAPSQVSAYQASADLAPSARLMQIGGELVPPSQASAWQASADLAPSARLVQIGGELVAPSQLSAWQTDAWNRAGSSGTLVGQKHDSGVGWGEAGITGAAGLAGLVVLIGASAVTLRRRRIPATLANMHP
jgi:hypothetical protein